MTATFSTYALEAMGFRDLLSQGSLAASFMSVTVFEARGVTFPEGFADARRGRVAGASYRSPFRRASMQVANASLATTLLSRRPNGSRKLRRRGRLHL